MSTFQKIKSQQNYAGTRNSLHNGQIITSTGNSSVDSIIGGGMVLGSIFLIEEDKFVIYSKVLAKYFLAEGVCAKHSLLVASLDDDTLEMVKKLPAPIETTTKEENNKNIDENVSNEFNMRIAWRYNDLPKVDSVQSSNMGRHFNLTKQISSDTIKNTNIIYWPKNNDINDCSFSKNIFNDIKYMNLLETIAKYIKDIKLCQEENNEKTKNVLRICITSFGSPLWFQDGFETDFLKFLTILKTLVRNSPTVCLLTIPTHLLEAYDDCLVPRLRNLIDYSISLEAFGGSEKETNPCFKEYHGLLCINKIAAVNSLAAYKPETTDLAFKLKRKKFLIEKLHLPPELDETKQREQDESISMLACSSSKKHLLEF